MEECEKDMEEEGRGRENGCRAGNAAWKRVSKFNLTECQGIKRFLFSLFHSLSLSPPPLPPLSPLPYLLLARRRSPRRTLLKRILTIFEKFFRKYDTKIFVTTDEIFHQHPNDIFPLSEKRTRWIALRLTTIIYLRENVSVVIENRDSRKEEENDTSDVTHSNKIYRLNKFNKGPLLIHSPMQPRCLPPLFLSLRLFFPPWSKDNLFG